MKDEFEKLLAGKKLSPLTRDEKWKSIFKYVEPSDSINKMWKQQEKLLDKQSEIRKQAKQIKAAKSKLMDEIMGMMESIGGGIADAATQKKLDENRRLITECNEKADKNKEEALGIPTQINQLNHDLMLETMELCYADIGENTKVIEHISEWITQVRIELKKQIIRKQDREERNRELYRYLHGLFGPEILDLFDEMQDKKSKSKKKG